MRFEGRLHPRGKKTLRHRRVVIVEGERKKPAKSRVERGRKAVTLKRKEN